MPLLLSATILGCSKERTPNVIQTEKSGFIGNEGGNGGGFGAQEIARTAGELLQILKTAPGLYPEFDYSKIEETILRTKVFMVQNLSLNGNVVVAKNNGVDTIWVSQRSWTLHTDHKARLALLFHEYLGILDLEHNTYQISQRILNPVFYLSSPQQFRCHDLDPLAVLGDGNFRIRAYFDTLSDRLIINFLYNPGTGEDDPYDVTGRITFGQGFPASITLLKIDGSRIVFENNPFPPNQSNRLWKKIFFLVDGSLTWTADDHTATCQPAQ